MVGLYGLTSLVRALPRRCKTRARPQSPQSTRLYYRLDCTKHVHPIASPPRCLLLDFDNLCGSDDCNGLGDSRCQANCSQLLIKAARDQRHAGVRMHT